MKDLVSVDLPKELAEELKQIDWNKVTERDLRFLKNFIPILKLKGYYKKINSEVKI